METSNENRLKQAGKRRTFVGGEQTQFTTLREILALLASVGWEDPSEGGSEHSGVMIAEIYATVRLKNSYQPCVLSINDTSV